MQLEKPVQLSRTTTIQDSLLIKYQPLRSITQRPFLSPHPSVFPTDGTGLQTNGQWKLELPRHLYITGVVCTRPSRGLCLQAARVFPRP